MALPTNAFVVENAVLCELGERYLDGPHPARSVQLVMLRFHGQSVPTSESPGVLAAEPQQFQTPARDLMTITAERLLIMSGDYRASYVLHISQRIVIAFGSDVIKLGWDPKKRGVCGLYTTVGYVSEHPPMGYLLGDASLAYIVPSQVA